MHTNQPDGNAFSQGQWFYSTNMIIKSTKACIILYYNTEIEECLHSRNGIKSKRAVSSASFFFRGLTGTNFSCWRQLSSAWPLKERIFAASLLGFERSYPEKLHLIICTFLSVLALDLIYWHGFHCLIWFSTSILYKKISC